VGDSMIKYFLLWIYLTNIYVWADMIFLTTEFEEIKINIINQRYIAQYNDGTSQYLMDIEDRLENGVNEFLIYDYNFDGYKDLAIFKSTDSRKLNNSYQLFYYNHYTGKFDNGANLTNPTVEGKFVIENTIGYEYVQYRYVWNGKSLEFHSKVSQEND